MQDNFGGGVVRESDFPNLREKLKIILMVEASPRELPRLFFPPPPETHNTCRRRQGWTENGQETFGTSKGTCKVESVKAALPHPDSFFLSLAILVWD